MKLTLQGESSVLNAMVNLKCRCDEKISLKCK